MRSKAFLMALLAFALGGVEAAVVSENEAAQAARALSSGAAAFRAKIGTSVAKVSSHRTTNGALFYAVKMADGGTVFMSGDTRIEPIICFTAADGDYSKIDRRSPLWALLNRDLSARQERLAKNAGSAEAERSWARLCKRGAGDLAQPLKAAKPSFPDGASGGDLRVDMLVQSQWAQGGWDGRYDDAAKYCYNFYTPVLSDGTNAVCGCVATAMSQLMRYHKYPMAAKRVTKECFVEPRYEMNEASGNEEFVGATNLTTSAEAFDWENMMLRPAETDPDGPGETVCQAIGRLTSDAGISVCMSYELEGSGAFMFNAATALREVFGYPSAAVYMANEVTSSDQVLAGALLANFDAGYPVLLGISGGGGHAIVADGYGFVTELDVMTRRVVSLPYVHLNMGWAGDCDFWYNLPEMYEAGFTTVDEVVFNVFPDKPDGSSVVSGRVLNEQGKPMEGVAVTLYKATTRDKVAEVRTSATGVWGAVLPGGVSYDIEAASDEGDKVAEKRNVLAQRTESVEDAKFPCRIYRDYVHDDVIRQYYGTKAMLVGNSWGNDLTLTDPAVVIHTSQGDVSCTTLEKAMWVADDLGGKLPFGEEIDIEIIRPVTLVSDWKISCNCRIRSAAANPAELAITRLPGAKVVVQYGARVLFTNLVFSAAAGVTLAVESGGTAALAGTAKVDEIMLADGGLLEMAGALDASLHYRVTQAGTVTVGTPFGRASVDLETAKRYANLFGNANNDELVGVASGADGDVALCWGIGPIPDSAAVVRLVQDGTSVNLLSLEKAVRYVTNDAEIVVLKDCPFAGELAVSKKVTISAAEGRSIVPAGNRDAVSTITVGDGGELVLTNVIFRGFSKFADGDDSAAVFARIGANGVIRMQAGAGFVDIDNSYGTYGAVKVEANGRLIMEEGSVLMGCKSERYGGGVYLASKAALDLCGGTISDCSAVKLGGGVYVVSGAQVTLSGPSTVFDNVQVPEGSVRPQNLYVAAKGSCPLTVKDCLVGAAIGISYPEGAVQNEQAGNVDSPMAFAGFGDTVAAADKEKAAEAFVNDWDPDPFTGSAAYVTEDGTGLVWGRSRAEPGTVPEADAAIRVDRAGKILFYAELQLALGGLTGGVARVTLLGDVSMNGKDEKLVVNGDVTLDGGGHSVYRGDDYRFYVKGEDNALTLTNVTVSGTSDGDKQGGACSIVRVEDGGLLVMEDGAVVEKVTGYAAGIRSIAAVSVWNARFTMREGAVIRNCHNDCDNGAGGGVIIAGDKTSVFRFEGGTITGCRATTGSGVQIDNRSLFIVAGDGRIVDNVAEGGGESNVYVSDLSYLVLTNEFTGSIGHSEGINADTNVFGRVQSERPLRELVPSAARFFRDDDPAATGCIVTNDVESLLVWTTALNTDESGNRYYEDKDGERYGLVLGDEPPPTPPEWTVKTNYPDSTPLAFKSIERLSDTEWKLVATNRVRYCNYRLLSTTDLNAGFVITGDWEHVVNEDCAVWTTNVITTGGAWFWRAEGTEGTNMVPPQVEQ